MDSERIILGSGKLYCMVFTGEIPADTAIEIDANQLAHIKGGASLEYTAETYTAKDDLGVVQKTILTSEDVTLKAGLLTWCAKTLEKLCATARVTETAKKRTVKIGGIKNQNNKKYLIRFLHEDSEDGNIRVTIVGRNEAGFSFTFMSFCPTASNSLCVMLSTSQKIIVFSTSLSLICSHNVISSCILSLFCVVISGKTQ